MDVIVERCAGLDVHRDNVVATVRVPGSGRRQWEKQTQTFKATLAGLAELALWLAEAGQSAAGAAIDFLLRLNQAMLVVRCRSFLSVCAQ